MGLLSRIKARLKSGVNAVNEEAKHPGKPPSYIEHDSPFFKGPTKDDKPGGAAPAGAPAPGAAPKRADRGESTPWFLDGQQDG